MSPFKSPAMIARLSSLLASQHGQRILLGRHQYRHHQLLCRYAVQLPSLFGRPSSMSAIVRGLRRTFRDPDGKRPPGYNPEVAAHVRQRRQEREAANVPTYKLFRGKKDITDRPVPKAKTRRARFFDPEDEYGKKSLVYQAKTGALEAEVKALSRQQRQERGVEEQDDGRYDSRSFQRDGGGRNGRSGRDGRSNRNGRDGRNNSYSDFEPRSRTRTGASSFGGRDSPQSRHGVTGRRDRGSDRGGDRGVYRGSERESDRGNDRWEDQGSDRRNDRWNDRGNDRRGDRGGYQGGAHESASRPYNRDRASERRSDTRSEGRFGREQQQDYEQDYDQDNEQPDQDNGRDSKRHGDSSPVSVVPLSIPYTTAASQFLYGRSVVEAALRSARRQLYKLYVYGGANRGGAPQDQLASQTIERLAKRRSITMQVVDERWQRLLDKMSKGRPHNGYVLEASPLPQPPLTALGPFTDGKPTANASGEASPFTTGPGFKVKVGYQSREEADVNGGSSFVDVDPTTAHRPLVLLLDQVLDPGNLGAILRSASFLGVSAVVVSKHSSATLTSVALKASAGAAEAMALYSVETPVTFLAQSRKAGWKVYAAVPLPAGATGTLEGSSGHSGRKPILDLDALEAADPLRTEAVILVMGSEGEGLPRAIRREADVEVSIANRSGSNVVDSLNVSVATGLLCASFLKGATRAVGGQAATAREVVSFQEESLTEEATEEPVKEEKGEETKVRDELSIF